MSLPLRQSTLISVDRTRIKLSVSRSPLFSCDELINSIGLSELHPTLPSPGPSQAGRPTTSIYREILRSLMISSFTRDILIYPNTDGRGAPRSPAP